MSWIAEYDTQGREFPTCVHVTKTTGTMTYGATYVPIEDGKAVRAENAKLRELVRDLITELAPPALTVDEINCGTIYRARIGHFKARARELGMEVDG